MSELKMVRGYAGKHLREGADEAPEAPAADGGGERSDIEICVEVLSQLLGSEAARTGWLLGFLVGSALAGPAVEA